MHYLLQAHLVIKPAPQPVPTQPLYHLQRPLPVQVPSGDLFELGLTGIGHDHVKLLRQKVGGGESSALPHSAHDTGVKGEVGRAEHQVVIPLTPREGV